MSFRPRIIADEDSAPLELPADLAELGTQLDDDARRLAQAYAATARPVRRSIPRWRMHGPKAAAVAAVVAIGVWGASRGPDVQQPGPIVPDEVATSWQRADGHAVGAAAVPAVNTVSPAVWFESLNAQEQEGLLDVLEDHSVRTTSISL